MNNTLFKKKIKELSSIINSNDKKIINEIVSYFIEHKKNLRNNVKINALERKRMGNALVKIYDTYHNIGAIFMEYVESQTPDNESYENLLKNIVTKFYNHKPNNATSSKFTNIFLEHTTDKEKYEKAKKMLDNFLIKKNKSTGSDPRTVANVNHI